MKARWGDPPWRPQVIGGGTPPPPLCQVAVVGGGLTGLAAAYTLARKGVRVCLLEADRVGSGASGRTGGIVLEDTAAGPLEGLGACIPALERLLATTGIDCGLRLGGCWELVHRPECAGRSRLWRDGEEHLCVDDTVVGGCLDPGALVSGLARAVLGAGGSIHEGRPVSALEPGPPVSLHTRGQTVMADHVLLALNAYTPSLVTLPARFAVALALATCTEELNRQTLDEIGLAPRLPFYTVDLPYLWGRPLPDGRIIFGSGLAFHPDGDLARIDIGSGEAQEALASLEGRIRRFHPALAGVRLAARWAGPIALVGDGSPILGRLPEAPQVIVTGGYAGHGVALSLRVGELAALAITDEHPLPPWGALRA